MVPMEKVMKYLNLLDSSGNLSITNLAVLITLVRLAISPSASITEAGSLLVALASYSHKRYITAKSKDQVIDIQDQINQALAETTSKLSELESKTSALSLSLGLKK